MNALIFQGIWEVPGKVLREFRLTLPDGRKANFTVKPGECLKARLAEVQARFAGRKEVAA